MGDDQGIPGPDTPGRVGYDPKISEIPVCPQPNTWVEEEILPELRAITEEVVTLNGTRLVPGPDLNESTGLPDYFASKEDSLWGYLSPSRLEVKNLQGPAVSFSSPPCYHVVSDYSLYYHFRGRWPLYPGPFAEDPAGTSIASLLRGVIDLNHVGVYAGDFFGTNENKIALIIDGALHVYHREEAVAASTIFLSPPVFDPFTHYSR